MAKEGERKPESETDRQTVEPKLFSVASVFVQAQNVATQPEI